jgi:hypothetical protein
MDKKAKKAKKTVNEKAKKIKKTVKQDNQKKSKDNTRRPVSGGGWFASRGPSRDAQGNPLKMETRMVYWEP